MRGDRPPEREGYGAKKEFTPHARGSTLEQKAQEFLSEVYPACAGIDRIAVSTSAPGSGLPRMRGDRPHSR